MYLNYEILLIKRFLFSKKSDGYISIFSWFSILGIMIGVSAIIIVMSVMNGFREELTSRLLGINGHINIFSNTNEIDQSILETLEDTNQNIFQIYPIIQTQALITNDEISRGIYIRSYRYKDIDRKNFLKEKIIEGKLYNENSNEILIGYSLAKKLNLKVGDIFKIAVPKSDKTFLGNIPRFKTLKISGIFDLGMYEYDSNFIFSDLNLSRKLLLLGKNNFNQIEIHSNDIDNVYNIKININSLLEKYRGIYLVTWKENHASLINALKTEKNVMFLILTLIVIVASMNIISGLIIFVKEKNKDIGILKTIGVSDYSLIKIFMTIGLIIGLIGSISGTIIGIIFSKNINSIQFFLENLLNQELFSKEVYYLSNLPSRLDYYEVSVVFFISIFISLLATIFPAYRSSKINPILTIKND